MKYKKRVLILVWLFLAVLLLVVSFLVSDTRFSIAAVVDTEILPFSFEHPVIVQDIHVYRGQKVKSGDTLMIVKRAVTDLEIELKGLEINALQEKITFLTEEQKLKLINLSLSYQIQKKELETQLFTIQSSINEDRRKAERLKLTWMPDSALVFMVNQLEQQLKLTHKLYQENQQLVQVTYAAMIADASMNKRILESQAKLTTQIQDKYFITATYDGFIGEIDVEKNQLVGPYFPLLTLISEHPILIKAYLEESVPLTVSVGDVVMVKSERGRKMIQGTVKSLGSRFVELPAKLQPVSGVPIRYGREIFIVISRDNAFLNGERVYIFPN